MIEKLVTKKHCYLWNDKTNHIQFRRKLNLWYYQSISISDDSIVEVKLAMENWYNLINQWEKPGVVICVI